MTSCFIMIIFCFVLKRIEIIIIIIIIIIIVIVKTNGHHDL